MRKFKSILIAVFLSLVCLFAVACGKVTGVYKTKSVIFDGVMVSVGELTPDSRDVLLENFCILELKENNTVQLSTTYKETTISREGSWVKKGKTVVLTFVEKGKTAVLNCVQNGNEITIDFSDECTVVVEKQ